MPLKSLAADIIRVKHMRDAIKETLFFIKKETNASFKNNRQLVLAVIKEIEMMGEAASKVTDTSRKKYPDIPWALMIRTRNRLIHGYFDIDEGLVWDTVQKEFPNLLKQLEGIIKENSD